MKLKCHSCIKVRSFRHPGRSPYLQLALNLHWTTAGGTNWLSIAVDKPDHNTMLPVRLVPSNKEPYRQRAVEEGGIAKANSRPATTLDIQLTINCLGPVG